MPRPSLTRADYDRLASKRKLEFIASHPPSQTRMSTIWRCIDCGRIRHCSYNNVKYNQNDCICRSGKTLTHEDYESLAKSLNLRWSGSRVPENINIKTMWLSLRSGMGFMASYHDLGYGRISDRMKRTIHGEAQRG